MGRGLVANVCQAINKHIAYIIRVQEFSVHYHTMVMQHFHYLNNFFINTIIRFTSLPNEQR